MKIRNEIHFAVFALLLLLICAGLVAIVYHWSITRVKSSTLELVGDRPYCIQVPGNGGYKEARSNDDLSIFKMRSKSGDHHAVLVIGDEEDGSMFHWSYWKGSFVQGIVGPPVVYCTPKQKFLGLVEHSQLFEPSSLVFRINGLKFAVPFSFRPTVISSGIHSGITFFALSPRFAPLNNPPEYNKPVSASDILSHIEVNFGKTGRPATWLDKKSSIHKVEEAGNEFGLNREFVWYLPSNSTAFVQYASRNERGAVTTLIQCSGGKNGSCLHTFQRDGWTYTFHHHPAEMPNWQAMQNNLVSVTNSFVISRDKHF